MRVSSFCILLQRDEFVCVENQILGWVLSRTLKAVELKALRSFFRSLLERAATRDCLARLSGPPYSVAVMEVSRSGLLLVSNTATKELIRMAPQQEQSALAW